MENGTLLNYLNWQAEFGSLEEHIQRKEAKGVTTHSSALLDLIFKEKFPYCASNLNCERGRIKESQMH